MLDRPQYAAAMTDQSSTDDAMTPLDAFACLDLRVGRVLEATPNPAARKPAFILRIDFGPLGIRTSSAQLTTLYDANALVDRLVIAAVNLGTRKIAGVNSEVLVLGLPDEQEAVVLLTPERDVPLGGRVY
ncbi:MAG: tRNA-binding protein [Phycisphaerales bacterium]|nr:tRNA-binding protein [Phycisphaerales bacterium]